jgi:dienelactone hydrolase
VDGGGVVDDGGAVAVDGGSGASPSRCTVGPTPHDIACDHVSATIGGRALDYETPLGAPPQGGWPVVLVYQGSLLSPNNATILAPHGMWMTQANDAANDGAFQDYVINELVTQTTILKRLLDGGYAVITPTADGGGFAWDTNFPPWSTSWSGSPDDLFLQTLYAAIDGGQLGPLSSTRWYATGVSSGGFMTSRMAVSYQGRFRSLVIAAGSYASCPGGDPACVVPSLPADHPPTLFLQGGQDVLVPEAEMRVYYDALVADGLTTTAKVDPTMLHGWLFTSPDDILGWFQAHP